MALSLRLRSLTDARLDKDDVFVSASFLFFLFAAGGGSGGRGGEDDFSLGGESTVDLVQENLNVDGSLFSASSESFVVDLVVIIGGRRRFATVPLTLGFVCSARVIVSGGLFWGLEA